MANLNTVHPHALLEINVKCNFESAKKSHNRLFPGNLSYSALADKD